jgi:hypothetical protein
MIKKVRKRARPTSTWFGGSCWVLRACLKKDKTTMMRVKEVMRTRIAGATERTVRRKRISRSTDTRSGSLAEPREMVSDGAAGDAAVAGPVRSQRQKAPARQSKEAARRRGDTATR